jgi:hypothetical protein
LSEKQLSSYESNLLANIEKHGCSVTSVFDPEGKDPKFSYSIGIAKTTSAPELIVVGLNSDISLWLVNEYNRRVRDGEVFAAGISHAGFLDGHDVQFVDVAETHRKHYMTSACWLHGGPGFDALQLVWPDASGYWPWDEEAAESYRLGQPILSVADDAPATP